MTGQANQLEATDDVDQPAVPGTVQLMTEEPLEVAPSANGHNPLAAQVEERPWLVAVALLGLLGIFLALRKRP